MTTPIDDKTSLTDDERIENINPLPPPEHLIRFFPIQGTPVEGMIAETRRKLRQILQGRTDRLLVVMGPCSIHDPAAAVAYAQKLAEERAKHAGELELLMRVYFEKPRTTVGWKGLINDPYLNGSFRINEGLRIARDLLVRINQAGVPAGCEFLDVISPQYIGDLVSWGAIGARTTESQVHRELASGLSAPVGFKNGTDGNVRIAVDALLAARQKHHFLSVHKSGQVAIVETRGNDDCHIILRGGKAPNYDAASVQAACEELERAKLPPRLMIDCSHANAAKQYRRQVEVANEIAERIAAGERRIIGLMVESHLVEGRQDLTAGGPLQFGQSITDACLGWEASAGVLETLAAAVRRRRSQMQPPK
jgi:3-deoxy-7-phosphoheptulonate synthase